MVFVIKVIAGFWAVVASLAKLAGAFVAKLVIPIGIFAFPEKNAVQAKNEADTMKRIM